MTQVDFYILQNNAGREQFACRIVEKAYRLGHRIYMHTHNAQQAARLDQLLWTFSQGSFIPHSIDGQSPTPPPPVLIGHTAELQNPEHAHEHEVLINLAEDIPLFFSSFKRVAEVIDQQPENKISGRERYRFYRDRGYTLENHNISL